MHRSRGNNAVVCHIPFLAKRNVTKPICHGTAVVKFRALRRLNFEVQTTVCTAFYAENKSPRRVYNFSVAANNTQRNYVPPVIQKRPFPWTISSTARLYVVNDENFVSTFFYFFFLSTSPSKFFFSAVNEELVSATRRHSSTDNEIIIIFRHLYVARTTDKSFALRFSFVFVYR